MWVAHDFLIALLPLEKPAVAAHRLAMLLCKAAESTDYSRNNDDLERKARAGARFP
jgi:hypothetical protein